MKAAAFDYVRSESLGQTLEFLAQHGGDAKLLAGGQSLVPMMAMRLVRPALLIDIHRLVELQSITQADHAVMIGAGVRQRTLEDALEDAPDGARPGKSALRTQLPLLAQALRWVGHAQTRNRGTVGGSLVHADPSAELPLAALVLNATLHLNSREHGERSLAASQFFLGPMSSATGETECLGSIEWPAWEGPGIGSAFDEVAIRHGDFALASAAAQVQLDAHGICRRASFGAGGVAGVPLVFPSLASALVGQRLIGQRQEDDLLRSTAVDAAAACDPGNDPHASAEFRRHLATVLITRVLRAAAHTAARALQGA